MNNRYLAPLRWIVVAILLALIPQPVHACSCPVPGAPAEELARASAVFSGKIINRQRVTITFGSTPEEQMTLTPDELTFDVGEVWKGPASPTLKVYSAVCAYEFQDDLEYLVYAYEYTDEGGEYLLATHCSPTKPLARAAEDLSALGEGVIPTEENPVLQPQPVSPLSPLIVGGKLSLPTCMLPLALVGMLGMLPMRVLKRAARR